MTINQLAEQAVQIRDAAAPGANTAEIVGGEFVGIVEHLRDLENAELSPYVPPTPQPTTGLNRPLSTINTTFNDGNPESGTKKILLWNEDGWEYATFDPESTGINANQLWGILGTQNNGGQIDYAHLSSALSSITWWGRSITTNGTSHTVSGNMTGVGTISMGESITMTKGSNSIQLLVDDEGRLCVTGDLYATGGVSALGIGEDGEGGGGQVKLNSPLEEINIGNLSYGDVESGGSVLVCKIENNTPVWSYEPYVPVDIASVATGVVVNALSNEKPSTYNKIDNSWLDLSAYALASDLATTNGKVATLESWQTGAQAILNNLPTTYLKKDFFDKLFQAFHESDGNEVAFDQNTDGYAGFIISSIKAKCGLWTDQYLSALGISSDSSGYTFDENAMWLALGTDINTKKINSDYINIGGYPVVINTPLSQSQILKFDGTKWKNDTDSSGGGGEITALESRVDTLEDKFNSSKSVWGRLYINNSGDFVDVTGELSNVTNILMDGNIDIATDDTLTKVRINENGIGRTNNGPRYFYFYPNGVVSVHNGLWVKSFIRSGQSSVVDNSQDDCCTCLRIGDGLLSWDSANNSLKVSRYYKAGDSRMEQPANLYATGAISALGIPNDASGSVDSANIVNIHAGKGDANYTIDYKTKAGSSESEQVKNLLEHIKYTPAVIEDGQVVTPEVTDKTILGNDSIDEVRGNEFHGNEFHGSKFYLAEGVYLYYDTTENKLILHKSDNSEHEIDTTPIVSWTVGG